VSPSATLSPPTVVIELSDTGWNGTSYQNVGPLPGKASTFTIILPMNLEKLLENVGT
jgi:hypothetical protein